MGYRIINPFEDYQPQLQQNSQLILPTKSGNLTDVNTISVGSGSKTMKVDRQGMWLGGNTFTEAPFRVDMEGNVVANAIQLASTIAIGSANGLSTEVLGANPGTESLLTGTSFSLTLDFPTLVHIVFTAHGWIDRIAAGDFGGNGLVRLHINGTERRRAILSGQKVGTDSAGAIGITTCSNSIVLSLAAGVHTVWLTAACDSLNSNTKFRVYNYTLSLVTLGALFS